MDLSGNWLFRRTSSAQAVRVSKKTEGFNIGYHLKHSLQAWVARREQWNTVATAEELECKLGSSK